MRTQHWKKLILLVILAVIAVILCWSLYTQEKAEDDRICDFIEERVNSGEGFTREEIDDLYRRYNCIDDKYSMPYRSERFTKLYEKHIKPL